MVYPYAQLKIINSNFFRCEKGKKNRGRHFAGKFALHDDSFPTNEKSFPL